MAITEQLYANTRANHPHTLVIFTYVKGKLVVTKKTFSDFDKAFHYSEKVFSDNVKIYDDKNHLVYSAKGKQPLRNELKNVVLPPHANFFYDYATYA